MWWKKSMPSWISLVRIFFYFDFTGRLFTSMHNTGGMYFLSRLMLVYSSVSGTTVFAEIQGVIDACVKLSGMPDLSLSFMVCYVKRCNVVMKPN